MGSEEEQRQALFLYHQSSLEDLKRKKRIVRKKIVLGIFLVFLIFIVGRFPFMNRFVANAFPKYLRFYDVRLNHQSLYVLEKLDSTSLLFGFLSFNNGETGSFSFFQSASSLPLEEVPYLLEIQAYSCFVPSGKRKIKVSCDVRAFENENKYKRDDVTYSNMTILKYAYDSDGKYILGFDSLSRDYLVGENSWKNQKIEDFSLVYEGEFMSDITSFIQEVGVYTIRIDFSYKHNTGSLYIGVVNDGHFLFSL